MRCSKYGGENPGGKKFCGQCTAALALVCPTCRAENPPGFKFCGQCTAALTHPAGKSRNAESAVAIGEGDEAAAIAGERKTVTALFADIKGSMELMEGEALEPSGTRCLEGLAELLPEPRVRARRPAHLLVPIDRAAQMAGLTQHHFYCRYLASNRLPYEVKTGFTGARCDGSLLRLETLYWSCWHGNFARQRGCTTCAAAGRLLSRATPERLIWSGCSTGDCLKSDKDRSMPRSRPRSSAPGQSSGRNCGAPCLDCSRICQ